MDWIECLDGSHVNKDRVIGVRVGLQGRSKDTYAVTVELDTAVRSQTAFRDIHAGTEDECKAYRDEFIGKSKTTPKRTSKAAGTKDDAE